MYTYLAEAIKADNEVILKLKDGSRIAGKPSWGGDRSRVKISSKDRTILVPLTEIKHTTTLLKLNAKKPTDR